MTGFAGTATVMGITRQGAERKTVLIELELCKGADTLKANLQVDHTPVQLCAHH